MSKLLAQRLSFIFFMIAAGLTLRGELYIFLKAFRILVLMQSDFELFIVNDMMVVTYLNLKKKLTKKCVILCVLLRSANE